MLMEPIPSVLAALSEGRTFRPLEPGPKKLDDPLFTKKGERKCGRRVEELPPLFFCLGPHTHHSGSALFSIGETRVSAGVSGPSPRVLQQHTRNPGGGVKSFHHGLASTFLSTVSAVAASRVDATLELFIEFAPFAGSSRDLQAQRSDLPTFISASVQAVTGDYDEQVNEKQENRALAEAVMETLRSTVRTNAYPNTTIEIAVMVLRRSTAGGLYAAIINAISLALMEARIATNDVLTASVAYAVSLPGDVRPRVCLHLEDEELEAAARAKAIITHVTLGLLTNRRLVAYLDMVGTDLRDPFDQELLQLAESSCTAIGRELGRCMEAADSVQ